jgi:hypothetical protein
MGLKSLNGFSAATMIDQTTSRPTNAQLALIQKTLTAAVSTFDAGKTARDRIFKGMLTPTENRASIAGRK